MALAGTSCTVERRAGLDEPPNAVVTAIPSPTIPTRPIRLDIKETYTNVSGPPSRDVLRAQQAILSDMLKAAGFAPSTQGEGEFVAIELKGTALAREYQTGALYSGAKYSIRIVAQLSGRQHQRQITCLEPPPLFVTYGGIEETRPEKTPNEAPFSGTLKSCQPFYLALTSLVREAAGKKAALAATIHTPDPGRILSKVGTVDEIAPMMVDLLSTGSDKERLAAFDYFDRVRHANAVEPLMKMTQGPTADAVQAIQALAHQRDARAVPVLAQKLIDCADSGGSRCGIEASNAIDALGQIGSDDAISALSDFTDKIPPGYSARSIDSAVEHLKGPKVAALRKKARRADEAMSGAQ